MDSDSDSSTRQAALAFLLERINYERTPALDYGQQALKLDRMRELLARLGNPGAQLPIVHVAGTKGKGSTSALIAAALSSSGHRTGLFTSPHLDHLEERFVIDGRPCSSEELVQLVAFVRGAALAMDHAAAERGADAMGPTYFELTTAMALAHFARRGADAAVLEVGMGGRLDSTNVCTPRVSVITSISFDHTQQLGNTLAEIAAEKAGIIKPGVPVISGVVDDEPREVIARISAERGCRLAQLGVDFHVKYKPPRRLDVVASPATVEVQSTTHAVPRVDQFQINLFGRHQAANAAVAAAVLDELRQQGWSLPSEAVQSGWADLRWPARIEVVSRQPTVVLDSAHNLASVEALVTTLEESFAARRRYLVFGTARDKDSRGMLARLGPHFDRIWLVKCGHSPRSMSSESLDEIAQSLGLRNCGRAESAAVAWDELGTLVSPDDLICVAGSFYLAAEMRREIDRKPLAHVS